MSKKETETSPPEEVVSPVDEVLASPPQNIAGDFAVAKEDLHLWEGGPRAHSAGETVPVVNVEKYGWQSKVQPLK